LLRDQMDDLPFWIIHSERDLVLILLCHIFLREFRGKLRAQHGHRGSRAWAIA
jgi:hypothetical protein